VGLMLWGGHSRGRRRGIGAGAGQAGAEGR